MEDKLSRLKHWEKRKIDSKIKCLEKYLKDRFYKIKI